MLTRSTSPSPNKPREPRRRSKHFTARGEPMLIVIFFPSTMLGRYPLR
jgi:hypothetical protein